MGTLGHPFALGGLKLRAGRSSLYLADFLPPTPLPPLSGFDLSGGAGAITIAGRPAPAPPAATGGPLTIQISE